MKGIKYIIAFLTLSSGYFLTKAQSVDTQDASRITELLALQPTETSQDLEVAMQLMERFTTTDITTLLAGLVPAGGDNAAIEYVTNSYSFHVVLAGKEKQRATFIAGAIDALTTLENKDNKGFIIQLLQQAGDETAVAPLSSYLHDSYLCEKAARALARIGTDGAGKALTAALPQRVVHLG